MRLLEQQRMLYRAVGKNLRIRSIAAPDTRRQATANLFYAGTRPPLPPRDFLFTVFLLRPASVRKWVLKGRLLDCKMISARQLMRQEVLRRAVFAANPVRRTVQFSAAKRFRGRAAPWTIYCMKPQPWIKLACRAVLWVFYMAWKWSPTNAMKLHF